MFAAAPTWLDQNVALASMLVLLGLAIVVLRVVRKLATRIALLALLLATAGFVFLERDEFEQCGTTCGCDPAKVSISVPFCDPVLGG